MKNLLLGVCLASSVVLSAPQEGTGGIPPAVQKALEFVNPNELKGDLSFLASDALQGRYTPSPGLEVAAEFIASKFRAAGLEPGGDHDYFQVAQMVDRRLPTMTTNLTVYSGDRTIVVPGAEIFVEATSQAVHLDHVMVVQLAAKNVDLLKALNLQGKVVLTIEPDPSKLSGDEMRTARRNARLFDAAVADTGALAIITVIHSKRAPYQSARLLFADQASSSRPPALALNSEELAVLNSAADHAPLTVSADIPAPLDNRVAVKNVIGILRGSDPELSKTAVLLTAHYDHIGTIETAMGMTLHAPGDSPDRIYNGANDDGSGTVSVIEIARALARMELRPKRSIVFMTFFGEERGLLGSQFYGKHPVFPISQTIADLNLEQMGRTDSTVGPQLNNASVTGFDYSEVTDYLVRAGKLTGIDVYRDPDASDAFFTRSDNDALAEQGIPAHTICVAFQYPDYHGLGDEWPKVDFKNMATVDRMVLLALFNLANAPTPPAWNAQNPKTEHFRAAELK